MDKIRIEKFLGLYTNADEASLNPEYQTKAYNVRFKAGSMESDGYSRLPVEDAVSVVYSSPVRLDEDRYGTKLVDYELIPDYTQAYKYYLLTVVGDITTGFMVKLDNEEVGEIDNAPVKVIESDGILKILTTSGTLYWLGRINRWFRAARSVVTIPFYLVKAPDLEQYIGPDFDLDYYGGVDPIPVKTYFRFTGTNTVVNEGRIEVKHYWELRYQDGEVFESGVFENILNVIWNYQIEYLIKHNVPYPDETFRNKYPLFENNWEDLKFYDERTGMYWIKETDWNSLITKVQREYDPAETGFPDKQYCELLFTSVYDDNSEFVNATKVLEINIDTPFLIRGSIITTEGFNLRMTAIGIYVRFTEKDDYEQLAFAQLTLGQHTPGEAYLEFVFDDLSRQGIFLSQTIGVVYNKRDYKPVVSFRDYIELQGIAYGIYQNRVYFCSVGKGRIMKEVFYDYIPEVEGKFLADVNGDLGAFDKQLSVINVQDSGEGYLLFSFKDNLNFSIRDQYDLGYSPEGIIIHTPRGIYVTNGYERQLISEQINDIVERNFESGNIFYDNVSDMLFYLCAEGSFRYDFVYQQWTGLLLYHIPTATFSSIKGILSFGYDGEAYQNIDGEIYKLIRTSNIPSIVFTPKVDLDYPNIAKIITYLVTDLEGILFYRDYNVIHSSRKTVQLGTSVGIRVPSAQLGIEFSFTGKIYSIEIYYDILGEFRNADYIPTPETYFEGPSQLTKLLESVEKQT